MDKWFERYKPFYKQAQKMFPGKTDVLVIGANDGKSFDPVSAIWNKKWEGVYMEPHPGAFEKLKQNVSGRVLPFAAGAHQGRLNMHFVRSEWADQFKQAAGFDPSIVCSWDQDHVLEHLHKYIPATENLPENDLISSFRTHSISIKYIASAFGLNLGIVQIDAEGMDNLLVWQAIGCRAGLILWEHSHMPKKEFHKLKKLAKRHRYEFVQMKDDSFIYNPDFKRSKKFPRRWDAVASRFRGRTDKLLGAEIGVWEGKMSAMLLQRLPNLRLLMVDRWEEYSDEERLTDGSNTITNVTASFWEDVYQKALAAASKYPVRATIIRQDSAVSAGFVSDNSLDFAFIDAGHSYEAVQQDIQAWLPKVKPGGWLCGHDYIKYDGVRQAVDECFVQIELDHNDTWFWRNG